MGLAQNISGSILGTITDNSGAVIPAAPVTVTNQDTGVEVKTQSGSSGEYVVPNLPPGNYKVLIRAPGFASKAVAGVHLFANRQVRVDVTLTPGTVQQTVEVRASAPVVNTENATIGNVMESSIMANLPYNRRQLDTLVSLAPGVTTTSTSNPRVAGSSYWGGIRYNVDGMSFEDAGNAGGAYTGGGLMTFPSPDTLSEFKMDSSNQKAEFAASVSVTVVTKSGTNQFHGTVFEFNRNKALAATNFFATTIPKPKFNRNEYGFTLGGPIRKNKTFFFGSLEELQERSAVTHTLSVATQAMRQGNFTGLATLTDPTTALPFSGNTIPTARLDSRATAIYNYVPLPNQVGTGSGTQNNWVGNINQVIDIMRYMARGDQHFSEKDVVWGGFTWSRGIPFTQAIAGTPTTYGNFSSVGHFTGDVNMTYLHTFSPRTMNEARAGWFHHSTLRYGVDFGIDPKQWFPTLYAMPVGGLPNMNITGFGTVGDYGWTAGVQQTIQYTDNLTHIIGRHTIKAGFNMLSERLERPASAYGWNSGVGGGGSFGAFTFTGRYTAGTGTAVPVNGFADYILGYPVSTARSTPGPNLVGRSNSFAGFVQDDWQVTSHLSVSAGIRWEMQKPWNERDNGQANFYPNASELVIPGSKNPPQAIAKLMAAYPIVLASSVPALANNFYIYDKKDFGPRVGIAWRPFSDTRTVIRAGAGLFYAFIPGFGGYLNVSLNNPPFLLNETFSAAAGLTPTLTLANPFPGGGTLSPNPTAAGLERNTHNAMVQQWNFSVEREVLHNLGLRASYVGNKTSHLIYLSREFNNPVTMAPGVLQTQRPYQPWAGISMEEFGGDSAMNQLQLEAIQRYKSGLTLQVEYSWSRSLDDTPVTGGPQNIYCNACDRGNSDSLLRHVLTAAFNYELPVGPGKRFVNTPGPLGKLAGGWMFSGMTFFRTGAPFSVIYSPSASGSLPSRANRIAGCDPKAGGGTRLHWFNTACFALPATQFTFGNAARNMLFAPGDVTLNLSLAKDTKIHERFTLEFRADAFNMPNHTNFNAAPGNNISSAAAVGIITSAADPRQMEFGLKLMF
jgi:hypothetical protein